MRSPAIEATPDPRPWEHWLLASKNGKVGYIDHEGRWQIEPQFSYGWRFSKEEDRAFVSACDGLALIDPTGRVVAGALGDLWVGIDSKLEFRGGVATIYSAWGPSRVIDKEGVVLFKSDGFVGPFVAGLASVVRFAGGREHATVEFVDPAGRVEIPAIDAFCWACSFDTNGLAPMAVKRTKWGYIDRNRTWRIPPQFETAAPFDGDTAIVKIAGKAAVIDRRGAYVIPPRFDEIDPTYEGLARVAVGGRAGFIDSRGEIVIPPAFAPRQPATAHFSEGLVAVRAIDSGSVGFIDHAAKVVVPPVFSDAGNFHDGVAPATASLSHGLAHGVCGYIDRAGKWISERRWDVCPDFEDGIATPSVSPHSLVFDGPPWTIEYVNRAGTSLGFLEFPTTDCADAGAPSDAPAGADARGASGR